MQSKTHPYIGVLVETEGRHVVDGKRGETMEEEFSTREDTGF